MIKLPPLPHQVKIIDYMSPFDQFALIGDPGIGKTCILLNIIEKKGYKKVLVICPKAVMDLAWGDDIPKFTDFDFAIIWDKDFSKRSSLLRNERIHVINYDVVGRMYDDLVKQNYDCIILDESTFIKTHSSKRTKACLNLSKHIKYRYISTGTPGSKPEKLWSQFYFIDPKTWDNKDFWKFREKYFYKIDANGLPLYFFNKKYIAEINERMYRKGLRVLKDEVQKYLPKRNFIPRLLDMPASAKKIYDTFKKDKVVGDIYTFFSVSERQKLLQMANGCLINDQRGKDRQIIELHDTKLKEVERIIEDDLEEDDQIIIWANYTEDIDRLHKLTNYPMICGGVNYTKTLRDFKDGTIKGIIAHPKSIAHGVTFIKCCNAIYYGLPDDLEYFQQSLDRNHRHGQVYPCNYYMLLCRNTIDEDILKNHKKNKILESELANQKKNLSLNNLLIWDFI